MACKSVNFNHNCDIYSSQLEALAKWVSCNGEVWGVGPTVVFASAAALFLYHELEASLFIPGDQVHVTLLEKTLVSTMVLGMLCLMIHLWVCSMRFVQYYLDTLIKDSPNVILEMTTAGLLGTQAELVPLGTLTRFLRQQQPQIHITVCWFLSLCYADYVRKHYCQRFNMPYLEQWQSELQERASRGMNCTIAKVNNFVGSVHTRLRGYTPQQTADAHTVRAPAACMSHASARIERRRCMEPAGDSTQLAWPPPRTSQGPKTLAASSQRQSWQASRRTTACDSLVSQARQLLTLLKNSVPISQQLDVRAAVHKSPASAVLAIPLLDRRRRSLEDITWRSMVFRVPSDSHSVVPNPMH